MASLRSGSRPALRSVPAAVSRSLTSPSSQASLATLSHEQPSFRQTRLGTSQRNNCRRQQIRAFATDSSSNPTPSEEPLPLEGITVVSLEQAIAAPFCTRQLAELGARVIKVERRGDGDFARGYDTRVKGLASHFVWTNRSKESLELDVKDPADFAVLKKLLRKTDVLVQNLAPGAADRLGLSHAALAKGHPALIVCDISGYGSYGPYRDKKAYDLLVQSEAGLLSVTGSEAEPAKVGISIADIAAGTAAFQNILAALLKRGKTGKGSRIDVSMLESMAEWMNFPLYYTFEGAAPPKRAGASHAAIYPYGPFQTGGGGSVMLGIQNEREWANLCKGVLGDAALATDERFKNNSLRTQNREELRELIHEALAGMGVDEVVAKLDANNIANARVNDMKGLWEHPQLKARGRWTEVDTPAGRVPALLPAGVADAGAVKMGPVPRLGEHNDQIRKELEEEEQ